MSLAVDQARARIIAQAARLPVMYGGVDFHARPERLTDDPADAMSSDRSPFGHPVTDEELDLVRAYTLLGDDVGDAYAALIPRHGFRHLVQMLVTACDQGLAAVPDAPAELVAFIEAMEATPTWVDMDLVRAGAREDRLEMAIVAPFAIRGALIATFLNKYAALPMALTGTLSHDTAARRVNETAAFFTTTVLPGALERHGAGFKAAAMVRLMHSMVRFNALRSGAWDSRVYGVPIPQVDQMPAGLIPIFRMSSAILAAGRSTFTPAQRAQVELARYRCFLLGLPEDLLPSTPDGIVRTMTARHTTLRQGFDDETCGSLVRATLSAYLSNRRDPLARLGNEIERRFAKVLFLKQFLKGDKDRARRMGVDIRTLDELTFALVAGGLGLQLILCRAILRIPVVRDWADAALVARLKRLLRRYGHAEFVTDATQYRQAHAPAAA